MFEPRRHTITTLPDEALRLADDYFASVKSAHETLSNFTRARTLPASTTPHVTSREDTPLGDDYIYGPQIIQPRIGELEGDAAQCVPRRLAPCKKGDYVSSLEVIPVEFASLLLPNTMNGPPKPPKHPMPGVWVTDSQEETLSPQTLASPTSPTWGNERPWSSLPPTGLAELVTPDVAEAPGSDFTSSTISSYGPATPPSSSYSRHENRPFSLTELQEQLQQLKDENRRLRAQQRSTPLLFDNETLSLGPPPDYASVTASQSRNDAQLRRLEREIQQRYDEDFAREAQRRYDAEAAREQQLLEDAQVAADLQRRFDARGDGPAIETDGGMPVQWTAPARERQSYSYPSPNAFSGQDALHAQSPAGPSRVHRQTHPRDRPRRRC